MKIAITGTQGTGKTALSYNIAAHYKSLGKSVKIIQEVARGCPFPINEHMTEEACLWIYLEQAKKELEACKNQVVISDRSVLDSFVYADYFEFDIEKIKFPRAAAFHQMLDYDKIIYVRPDLPLHNDGFRSTDKEFQDSIDKHFEDFLTGFKTINIFSSHIFDIEETWKQYCL